MRLEKIDIIWDVQVFVIKIDIISLSNNLTKEWFWVLTA